MSVRSAVLIVTAALLVSAPASPDEGFDARTAGFALVFHGERSGSATPRSWSCPARR